MWKQSLTEAIKKGATQPIGQIDSLEKSPTKETLRKSVNRISPTQARKMKHDRRFGVIPDPSAELL